MNEFTKDLGVFLSRDIMYVLGGTSFLLSVAFASGIYGSQIITGEALNIYTALFLFGIAYCIGYMNQEILSLTNIVTTRHIIAPPRLLLWLYKRLTDTEWKSLGNPTNLDLITLRQFYKPEELKELDRIISLKHIGSAVGSNWFFSSIVLIAFSFAKNTFAVWSLSFYLLFASLSLIVLAWIRGMDQAMLINELRQNRILAKTVTENK